MTTFLDHVQQARRRARKQPDVAERCLRDAEPLAETPSDWADLAEGWAGLGSARRDEVRRCAERALDGAGAELSIYRHVATTYGRELADLDGARRVIERCAAALAARGGPSFDDACRLADVYVRVVDDRVTARGLLERAEAAVPSPSSRELCALAETYRTLGDLDAARARVDRAATVIDGEADEGDAWTVANAQRALGDADGGWRTLERGLARATTIGGCVRIARAAASHLDVNQPEPGRPLMRACLSRAEGLAATAADWVEIGDVWHELLFGADDVRRALEAARARDPDAEVLGRIAHGYRHWLRDAETADRLAPRGLAPAAIASRHQRLDGWDAAPAALLDWLRPHVGPRSLRAIAERDWGSDPGKHGAVLEDIVATGLVPQPLLWHPREVLELTRWTEGDKTDHVARAFACTVLLVDAVGPIYRDGHEQTIPVLIDSCLVLGTEAMTRAVGLLVAVAEGFEDFRVESLFAYLGVLVAAAACDPRDARLPALAERLVAAEAAHGVDHRDRSEKWGWLLRRTNFDLRHKLWQALGARVLGEAARADASLAHLADIAERLRA